MKKQHNDKARSESAPAAAPKLLRVPPISPPEQSNFTSAKDGAAQGKELVPSNGRAGENAAQAPTDSITKHNPFDPARYRVPPNYGAELGVKKVITNLPCRKPMRHEFVRTRPGDEWRYEACVFEDRIQREFFLVEPEMAAVLSSETIPMCLYLAVNRQNDPFLWSVKMPAPDGRTNQWNDSAAQAAKLAETRWIRLSSNMMGGFYDVHEATAQLSEPQWPALTMAQLLEICFRDRIIDSPNHIAVRRLQGEV